MARRGFSIIGRQNIMDDEVRFETPADAVIRVVIGEKIFRTFVWHKNAFAV